MAVLSSDLVKRKKEHVFVAGYEINCATELTGSIDGTSEIYHVYGDDNAIKDVTINTGALTVAVYDKETNNVLLDALQKIDTDDTSITSKQYNWSNIYPVSVWANRFNDDNDEYQRSIFYGNWLPIPAVASGDANAKAMRTFSGNCDVPKEFTEPIMGEKLALTTGATGDVATASLAYIPLIVNPAATTSLYAVQVVVIQEKRSGTTITSCELEDITSQLDASMVTSGKAVSIDFSDDCSSLTWGTHVYVNYLYNSSSGVYPAVKHDGMFSVQT